MPIGLDMVDVSPLPHMTPREFVEAGLLSHLNTNEIGQQCARYDCSLLAKILSFRSLYRLVDLYCIDRPFLI